MQIIESIQKRRSARTFSGEPLRQEHVAQIKTFIHPLQAPFGIKARIELLHTLTDGKPVKLGTYGYIKGACDYLALIYEEAPFAETAAAYLFEQVTGMACTIRRRHVPFLQKALPYIRRHRYGHCPLSF